MKMLNLGVLVVLAAGVSQSCINKTNNEASSKSSSNNNEWRVEVPQEPTTDATPSLSWPLIDDAASYDLVVATDPNCESNIVQTHKKLKSPSLEMTESLADGEYYICITAINRNGKMITTRTSASTRFVVDTIAPSAPSGLKFVTKDNDQEILQTSKTEVKLTWDLSSDALSGVRGYQVEYFLGAGCKNKGTAIVETSEAWQFLTVAPGNTYSYKVTAVDRAGNYTASECSPTSLVVIATQGPNVTPALCSFSIGDKIKTLETYTPTITWSSCDDAETYTLVVDDESDCLTPIQTKENIDTLQVMTNSLLNGRYYACVYGVNNTGGRKAAINSPYEFVVSVPTNIWRAIPTEHAPAPRAFAAMGWTGEEVLVWGGLSGSNIITLTSTSSGGRFNPSTNTWKAMSTLNAPTGNMFPSSYWTGEKWIVWGGLTSLLGGYSNEGGIYDPEKDSWTLISTVNAPLAREGAELFWFEGKVYIWGGAGHVNYVDGKYFDPTSQTWTTISMTNAPSDRSGYVSIWTGQKLIVWSGLLDDGSVSNDGAIYDPKTDSWTSMSVANAPEARYDARGVLAGLKIVVWGGVGSGSAKVGTGGIYDLENNTWTTISKQAAPTPRINFAMIWTGEKVIVWGGETAPNTYAQNGAVLDLASNSWVSMSTKGAPSGNVKDGATFTMWHKAANKYFSWTTDNQGGDGSIVSNGGGLFNPESNSWTAAALENSVTPRSTLLYQWMKNELFVWGGFLMDPGTGDTVMKTDGAIYTP